MLVRSAFSVSIAVVVSLISLSVQTQSSVASQAGRTSVVEFSTSCDVAVASEINRAVELLHSFEYPESGKAFRSILHGLREIAPSGAGEGLPGGYAAGLHGQSG